MKKRTPWQRLTLSLIGIGLIGATWRAAIAHLYKLNPETLAAFTTLTVNSQYIIGAIVIFMVTGRLVYEWKMDTAGNQIFKSRTHAPKQYDDAEIF